MSVQYHHHHPHYLNLMALDLDLDQVQIEDPQTFQQPWLSINKWPEQNSLNAVALVLCKTNLWPSHPRRSEYPNRYLLNAKSFYVMNSSNFIPLSQLMNFSVLACSRIYPIRLLKCCSDLISFTQVIYEPLLHILNISLQDL
ncbi:hypothetical protein ES705_38390 [subsurface metagenome]